MTGTKRDYDYFHAVSYLGLLTFLSVDKGQRQVHVLNRYLPEAWGLRKDDVTLGSIMRGRRGINIDWFSYWMKKQLLPYVKHGTNILERLDYDNGIHYLFHSTKYILEDVYKDMPEDSSGERYYTVLEVKAAIALATIAFFDAQRKDSFIFFNFKDELESWSKRLSEAMTSQVDQPLSAPLRRILAEIKKFTQNDF